MLEVYEYDTNSKRYVCDNFRKILIRIRRNIQPSYAYIRTMSRHSHKHFIAVALNIFR